MKNSSPPRPPRKPAPTGDSDHVSPRSGPPQQPSTDRRIRLAGRGKPQVVRRPPHAYRGDRRAQALSRGKLSVDERLPDAEDAPPDPELRLQEAHRGTHGTEVSRSA